MRTHSIYIYIDISMNYLIERNQKKEEIIA